MVRCFWRHKSRKNMPTTANTAETAASVHCSFHHDEYSSYLWHIVAASIFQLHLYKAETVFQGFYLQFPIVQQAASIPASSTAYSLRHKI